METQLMAEKNNINSKVIGSLLIGFLSLIGLLLVQEGSLLSIIGILFGIVGLIEIKQQRQKGIVIAILGLVLNCIGLVSYII